jgi:hypothetical protein
LSERGSHERAVDDSVTSLEARCFRVTDSLGHGGVPSENELRVLNLNLISSIQVDNHLSESIVDL